MIFHSFFSLTFAQSEDQNEASDNEISIMEFVFEKDKSPTLKEDEFPQKAIQILSKHETTTSYKLKYDVEIALNSESEDNYTITFISKEVIGGMYRNFSIADYLLPEQVSFDVTWGHKTKDDKKDNKTIKKEFSKVEFDINHKVSVDVSFPLTADYRPILIEKIVFHYGDLQEKGLTSRIKLIDEYYNESQKIESFLTDLNAIQKEKGFEPNSKKELEAKQKLQPIESAIRKLDAYASELITDEEDPVKLRQQLSKLKTSYTQTRSMLFTATAESEKACQDEYQQGKQYLENGKANSAQLSFTSVLARCPTHVPSLIRRAQLFYQEGKFDNARQDLSHLPKGEELTTALKEESDLQTAIESVYFDLFAFFIRKGDYASKNLEFDEAFNFFSQAEEICEQNPFLPNCTEQLAPRLTNAKKDQLEYLDAQIRNSLYENNLSEAVGFVVKSKSIIGKQEPEGELKKHTELLTQKLEKRTNDAIIIQNWEEALEALELNVGLKTGLTYSDSSLFWKEVGQKIQTLDQQQNHKDLLIYATARYSQLNLPLTNSLLKRLTQTDISKNEWQQLGQDIGKKDYYLQPTANPEEIITKYVLLDPALNKNFQKGYFQVWKELGKE
ncbi:tetratricopeptide repeat protein [Bernardetia sp. OM2101]|uniref:tetratricopeptide repeat protein n=1 Tax=Bernardetia sp. OM2101 TaxID=3344876 RepID=UPI0035D071F1